MSATQSNAGTSTLMFTQSLIGILDLANGTAVPTALLDDPTLGTVVFGAVSGNQVPFGFFPTGQKTGSTVLHFEIAGVDYQPGDLALVITAPPPPPPAETASVDTSSLVIAAWDGTTTTLPTASASPAGAAATS